MCQNKTKGSAGLDTGEGRKRIRNTARSRLAPPPPTTAEKKGGLRLAQSPHINGGTLT